MAASAGTAGGRISAGVGMNQIGQHAQERNQEATVYVGNLDPQVTEELVWELMVQVSHSHNAEKKQCNLIIRMAFPTCFLKD